MAIKFKIVPRKNPLDPTAAPKYYAQVVPTGKLNLEELAKRVANHTTMGVPDVYGVLKAMEEAVLEGLHDGIQIEFGSLCDIYPHLQSEGAESEESFSVTSNIKRKGIRILAKRSLRRKMSEVPVEKVE